jgi:hypothetical protein
MMPNSSADTLATGEKNEATTITTGEEASAGHDTDGQRVLRKNDESFRINFSHGLIFR